MITVESFRQKIRESQSESLLDEVLLAPEAIHIAAADIEHIKAALVRKFDATTAGDTTLSKIPSKTDYLPKFCHFLGEPPP